jgi:hypothetical protein
MLGLLKSEDRNFDEETKKEVADLASAKVKNTVLISVTMIIEEPPTKPAPMQQIFVMILL